MKLTDLDVLALAGLPESALVPKLANKKLDGPFTMEDARILVRALKPDHGTLEKLARAIYEEVQRQRKLRDARRARTKVQVSDLRKTMGELLAGAYPPGSESNRLRRNFARTKLAFGFFGDYIRNSFDEEILALLELMTGTTYYRVNYLDVGSRPVVACVVQIQSDAKGRPTYNFLLYRRRGKVKGVPTIADTVKDAWADQVPPEALEIAEEGYSFHTDFENQTMIATQPDKDEIILPWKNRLDDA